MAVPTDDRENSLGTIFYVVSQSWLVAHGKDKTENQNFIAPKVKPLPFPPER
jgi:hypothetical protein